jgi:hypothetical protein
LAIPLAALLTVGPAQGAEAAPNQVAGVVVSGLFQYLTQIGVPTGPVTFNPDSSGDAPVKYEYWINGGKHKTIKADKTGSAIVHLTFATQRNALSVEGIGADGTAGYVTFNYYYAIGAHPAADKDSNGDGVPDLLTVGDPAGLGSGIWLAAGNPKGFATGRVRTPAVNIDSIGPDFGDPSYLDGAQLITGNFLGDNLQDALVYFVTGPKAGAGLIAHGSGDGSPLHGTDAILASSVYFSDINGDTPIDLANAYDSAGSNFAVPDFIGIGGSATNGYHLTYYPMQADAALDIAIGELTDTLTPTGGTDWNNWQLFSTDAASGTAIYLWNSTTGALYLWEAVRFTDNGDFTGSISYTQFQIAKKWNAGATFATIEAMDFTGDNVPDLWTVTPAGVATAYVVSALSTTAVAKINAKTPQNLF